MPTVSVLMSTYNGEKYLNEQIESILNQEGVSVQLQVRDDGSSDNTLTILEQYQQEGKLEYIKGNNIGYGSSFMWLVMHARKADYYAFSDQDDVWDSKKLITAINQIIKYNKEPVLCITNFQMVDELLVPIQSEQTPIPINIQKFSSEQLMKAVAVENIIAGFGCTQVWNQQLQTIAMQAKQQMTIPHDYVIGMIAIYTGRFLFCEEKLMQYRQHGNNNSGSRIGIKKITRIITRNIKTLIGKPEQQISKIDKSFYDGYAECIEKNNAAILERAISYNISFVSRIKFLFSDYCNGFPIDMWIKTKLKILLGRL